jgi:hypothetical protein
MKHKVIVEGIMKFTFAYSIEADTSLEALDEGLRKVQAMNNPDSPATGYGQFEETPKIVYHVKEVKEEKDNE